jgi:hypothetical protein
MTSFPAANQSGQDAEQIHQRIARVTLGMIRQGIRELRHLLVFLLVANGFDRHLALQRSPSFNDVRDLAQKAIGIHIL